MAYSISQTLGDGVTELFNVEFPFITRDHVAVQVDSVPTAFSWVSDAQIQITPAPAVNAVVDIRRSSGRGSRLVNYQDASVLTEALMDADSNQAFYIAQEAFDEVEQSIRVGTDGAIDAQSKRIKNVAAPVEAADAANKSYVESFTLGSAVAAAASASEAGGYASQALTAMTASETARDEAVAAAASASADAVAADLARIAAEAAASGGVQTVTAGDSTLTVGGTPTDPQLALNLANKNTWTGQQSPKSGTLTDAPSIDWDGDANGQVVAVNLAGSRTLNAPTNIQQYALYILRVSQDATGGRVLAWNSAYKFGASGAPVLTTSPVKVDILCFIGGSANTLEFVGSRLDAV